jgi:O-antigen/teichoic acid export membrane protein
VTTALSRRLPSWLAGSGVIAVSMGVMNVATYAFTVLTARVLGPREFGSLAALMGVMLVLNVLSMGLMATAARRVSATRGPQAVVEHDVARTGVYAALALGLVTLLAVPLFVAALRLDTWVDAALMSVAMVPLTIMGAHAGILQGERRWGALAAVFVSMGLGRVVLGGAAVLWRPDTTAAMAGVAAGAFLPALVGWWTTSRRQATSTATPAATPTATTATTQEPSDRVPPHQHARSFLAEVGHNSHTLLAFFALANADVVLSRSALDEHTSGLYAGGLILTKAVLFLPQFVVVLVFPAMAASGGSRRTQAAGVGLVALVGLGATLGAWALPDLAVTFVGGDDYAELGDWLWAFAAIGTLLGMIQMLVYGTLARQHRAAVWVIWGGVASLALTAVVWVDTLTGLLAAVLTVMLAVFVCLGGIALGRSRVEPTQAELEIPRGVGP